MRNKIQEEFQSKNPDYPLRLSNLRIESCEISDEDIPSGNDGINGEGYTYKQLRHHPLINQLLDKISNEKLKSLADYCNNRNTTEGFNMYKINGEYCFWGLRIGPVVKTPSFDEIRVILMENAKTKSAVENHTVEASMIREITYMLLRNEVAKCCNMTYKEATLAIGNQLDCAPHEDKCGSIFMVPNWAHKWFRHDGYVSTMLELFNK